MSASDALHPALFHGTAHWFQTGDTVDPTVPATGIAAHSAAWGTHSLDSAAQYAAAKASKQDQPPLFAPVYEVEPSSTDLRRHPTNPGVVGDRQGMYVKRLAGYASHDGALM